LLNRIVGVSKDTIDKLGEVAPFIIFALIWLFGVIAKTVQTSRKASKGEQKARDVKRQPGFGDFIEKVRERYAEAMEQAERAMEQRAERQEPPVQASQPRPRASSYRPEAKAPLIEVTVAGTQAEVEKAKVEKPSAEQLPPSLPTGVAGGDTPHSYLAELAEQYKDAGGLRKAILHYEILGTPVSLRE